MSIEEQMDKMYGESFAAIERASRSELVEGIRSGEKTYTEGVVEETAHRGKDFPSPWTLSVRGPRERAIRRLHEERSARAQDVDERQNAPVTTDENTWIANPNRYDYPGVDTIPERRQAARAEAAAGWALEEGILDRAEHKGGGSRLKGKFSPAANKTYGKGESVVRVQKAAETPSKTLAHEVGHAIDYGAGGKPRPTPGGMVENMPFQLTKRLFDDERLGLPEDPTPEERRAVARRKTQLKEEARRISQQSRGGIRSRGKKYRTDPKELTADFIASAVIQPRATRREAPTLSRELDALAAEMGFGDIFPEPLGRDPERRGILDV